MKVKDKDYFYDKNYEKRLDNNNYIWIKENKEEFAPRVGMVKKTYFTILNEKEEELGITGEYVLKDEKLIFFNIVYDNEENYAEFYQDSETKPIETFLRYDDKLYLKVDNDFFEVRSSDERVGLDSTITILGNEDRYKYSGCINKISKDRKLILNVYSEYLNK